MFGKERCIANAMTLITIYSTYIAQHIQLMLIIEMKIEMKIVKEKINKITTPIYPIIWRCNSYGQPPQPKKWVWLQYICVYIPGIDSAEGYSRYCGTE